MVDQRQMRLVIEGEDGHRQVVAVPPGEFSIGRLPSSTLHLSERNVSRNHARCGHGDDGLWAEDLESFNGLWVNGKRVTGRRSLAIGDLLGVGDFRITLQLGDASEAGEEVTGQAAAPGSSTAAVGEATRTQPAPPLGQVARPSAFAFSSAPPASSTPAEGPRSPEPLPAGERPRLVCVSTEFAGQIFEIARTEVVIGRVADNEIGIDHRSVSRQHAKIVATGRRFVIADLQSANGTFVNAEAYAQAELKRGDLIELGHVKLRFVPAGESYTPTAREAAAIRRAQRPRERGRLSGLLVGGAVLACGLGAVAGYLILGGPPPPPPPEPAPAAKAGADPVASTAAEVNKLLAQARDELGQKHLHQARALLGGALALQPNRSDAVALKERVDGELRAEHSIEAAGQAVGRRDWKAAQAALEEVPPSTTSAAQASTMMAQVRAPLIAELQAQGRAALHADALDDAAARLDDLEHLGETGPVTAELRAALQEARSRGGAPPGGHHPSSHAKEAPRPPAHPPAPPRPPAAAVAAAAAPAAAGPSDEAHAVWAEGIRALKAGQLQHAIEVLGRCGQPDHGYAMCYRALGIAHARAGNGPRAVKFYRLYLKAEPNGPEATQVRELLQQYEAGH